MRIRLLAVWQISAQRCPVRLLLPTSHLPMGSVHGIRRPKLRIRAYAVFLERAGAAVRAVGRAASVSLAAGTKGQPPERLASCAAVPRRRTCGMETAGP